MKTVPFEIFRECFNLLIDICPDKYTGKKIITEPFERFSEALRIGYEMDESNPPSDKKSAEEIARKHYGTSENGPDGPWYIGAMEEYKNQFTRPDETPSPGGGESKLYKALKMLLNHQYPMFVPLTGFMNDHPADIAYYALKEYESMAGDIVHEKSAADKLKETLTTLGPADFNEGKQFIISNKSDKPFIAMLPTYPSAKAYYEKEMIESYRACENMTKLYEQKSAEVNKLVDAIEKLEEWNRHYPAGKIYQYDQAKTMETQLTVCINNCIAAKEALTNYKK